ncbi:PREDICTED: uncharacterized protein LOC104596007 isoform X2 [Nelumbo nucifera]|uniref:Uncharacterized protein LOC104596007 isoform X2 n=2 Tax=Nelumbo nucifera TaxID=4432 RepID=A0A1U7ZPI7_NELNU|nr:PREDICTED: uncharacterized protein LOC104596007 isoform X2 [Nelumbo nucifera]DAD18974.1 TPA_asm: hypothetical protein HUJ06_020437 [Nelumbo nucifera]
MRIRKHAKMDSLAFPQAPLDSCARASLQTHVCELNRSPWDVMAFAPQSDLSYPDDYQAEGDDSVTGNGSGGESIGAAESLASLKVSWEEEEEEEPKFSSSTEVVVNAAEKRERKIGLKKGREGFVSCNKTDGKGWQCRREAKEGHSLCEHHLMQLRSYHHSYSNSSSRKSDKSGAAGGVRRRNRGRISSSTNPLEFYYYSGFGPLWGKRRGGGGGGDSTKRRNAEAGAATQTTSTPPSTSDIDQNRPVAAAVDDDYIINEIDIDMVDEDDDDDNDDGVGHEGEPGRKRVRKPVKARSLKSLL